MEIGKRLDMPMGRGGAAMSTKNAKTDFAYKSDHLRFFNMAGLAWPPADLYSEIDGYSIHLQDVCERQAEIVYLAHRVWPPTDREEYAFLDANPSLSIIIQTKLKGEEVECASWRCPWASKPMCLVGSGSMIVRITRGKDRIIRPLEGFEYFALQGWFGSDWAPNTPAPSRPVCANFMGNAFCAFALAPLMSCSLAMSGNALDAVDLVVVESASECGSQSGCCSDVSPSF